jgi:hypothetical protein
VEGQDGHSFQVEIVLDLSTLNGEPPSGDVIRRLVADRLADRAELRAQLRIRRVLIRPRPQHD